MSVTIKSIGGHELYVAEGATTIRQALGEAAGRGADLRGADLQGAYLRGAYLRGAYLQGADLQGAYLQGADLQGAYLQGADLRGADLQGAYLQGADLRGADLQGADLRGADLRGADGLNPHRVQPLLMLLDQPGPIRAYKLVDGDGHSPIHYALPLHYEIGEAVSVADAETNPLVDCGAGVNVATLDWCAKNWREGWRILVVEFTKDDIAAIPTAGDGKFRLHRCKVVAEKDLAEIGLVKKAAAAA